MFLFPKYNYQFITASSPVIAREELMNRIQTSDDFQLLNRYTTTEQVAFSERIKFQFHYNSYKPLVKVGFVAEADKTRVVADFSLNRSVKAIIGCFSVVCLALEFVMLYFALSHNLSSVFLVFIPLALLGFLLLFSQIAFRLSLTKCLDFLKEEYT